MPILSWLFLSLLYLVLSYRCDLSLSSSFNFVILFMTSFFLYSSCRSARPSSPRWRTNGSHSFRYFFFSSFCFFSHFAPPSLSFEVRFSLLPPQTQGNHTYRGLRVVLLDFGLEDGCNMIVVSRYLFNFLLCFILFFFLFFFGFFACLLLFFSFLFF